VGWLQCKMREGRLDIWTKLDIRFTRSEVGPVAMAGLKWDKSDDLRKRKSK
jgi:hypothetical protein